MRTTGPDRAGVQLRNPSNFGYAPVPLSVLADGEVSDQDVQNVTSYGPLRAGLAITPFALLIVALTRVVPTAVL